MIIARAIAVLMLVALLALPGTVPGADACSCERLSGNREKVQRLLDSPRAEVVIVGKVETIAWSNAAIINQNVCIAVYDRSGTQSHRSIATVRWCRSPKTSRSCS